MTRTRAEGVTVMTAHRFQLRRGLEISVDLPDDLDERDVERLGRWLASLPMPVDINQIGHASGPQKPAYEHDRCGVGGMGCPSGYDHDLWLAYRKAGKL